MRYLVLLLILASNCTMVFCEIDENGRNACSDRPQHDADKVGGNNIPGVPPKKTLRKH